MYNLINLILIAVLFVSPVFAANSHGWIGTETVKTRFGNFDFKEGYPTAASAQELSNLLILNRAVEVYLEQLPVVSYFHVWKGVAEAGSGTPNQLLIWETLMDSETLLLTGNTETVYGLSAIDLKRDGPTVIEVPPMMLGGLSDLWQGEIFGIGPKGTDRGKGGKFLLLPPDYKGAIPSTGYWTKRSPTYKVVFGVRGFLVDGKPDHAVALMKSARIYPLSKAANPPPQPFFNASGKAVDTLFSDNGQYFEDLAQMVAAEPTDRWSSREHFELAAIGIEKGKIAAGDPERMKTLAEAARLGAAIARANSFDNKDPERLVYPDRRWEWAFIGGRATWDSQGYVNTDRRAAFAYVAIGMSPAMVEKVVGQGSQYYWTPRGASGDYLDGGKSYRLHLPGPMPVKNFWSVVVYDSESRSILRNGEKFPSISQYTGPAVNADGSVDIFFGPASLKGKEKNWIKTVKGKGWFPLLRFYGPLQPLFDGTWKPDDISEIK